MYEVILIVLVSIIVLLLIANNFRLFFKNRKMLETLIQSFVERNALEDMIKTQAVSEEKPIDQTEGFIKFLSESREWAFNYIEDVQQEITKFGVVLSEAKSLAKDAALKKILAGYEELKKFLPDLRENNVQGEK
jgi:hypothetical protein